jgi:hypothetical protein
VAQEIGRSGAEQSGRRQAELGRLLSAAAGYRLWSRFREPAAGGRYVVSVDERGEVTMIPAEPKRN